MASVSHGVALNDSSNVASYQTGVFIPAAGDLLVVMAELSATVATLGISDSQGLGWTLVENIPDRGGATQAQMSIWVSNTAAANTGMTVTVTCTGDNATGANILVALVAGMSKFGATAIKQSEQATGAASTTPEVVFGASALTGNPTIGFVGNNNNAAAVTEPSGWTEQNDSGYASPTTGAEYASRDSGFTGTTITWGGTSASAWGAIILELDASASGPSATRGRLSFAELETPNLPTRGRVSFVELEVPTVATRGRVSFVELEVPTVLTRGRLSFAELETPSLGVDPTRGRVSFAELEVPSVSTRGRVSFVELEVPSLTTRGRVAWVELEVPFVSTRGRLSFAEVEVPSLPTRGRLAWVEFEVPEEGQVVTRYKHHIMGRRGWVQRGNRG